jgi:peptidoglycan/LPS O-acetylase OafA/YrhL
VLGPARFRGPVRELRFFGGWDLKDNDSRLPFLDLLRAVASQAIVWHHLAFYGPLSDSAHEVAASLIDGLYQHARLAVQVFFVVSGYLTAISLSGREPGRLREFFGVIAARYRRIGLPYLGALLLAIGANEFARQWMTNSSISGRPSLLSVLAHVFLIHDLVGYEPLSAGIWYLAIDLQLITLFAFVFWFSARVAGAELGARLGRALLGALGVLSLFWFNRHPSLDRVAIYFMGSYVLGLVVAWVQGRSVSRALFWIYALLIVVAVAVDFRSRLLVALATGLVVMAAQHFGWISHWPRSRLVRWLAGISYSLFLVHFPVSLVVNALWSSHVPATPWLSLLGMAIAYAFSMVMAVIFHYGVERHVVRIGRGARPRAPISALLERAALPDPQAGEPEGSEG